MKGLASEDWEHAATLVSELSPSAGKSAAAIEVARKIFPDWNTTGAVSTEAKQWLSNLDTAAFQKVIDRMSWNWVRADYKDFANYLASPEASAAPASAISDAARTYANQDPENAVAWAQKLPENKAYVAAQSAFNVWYGTQPDRALEWLSSQSANTAIQEEVILGSIRSLVNSGEPIRHFPTPRSPPNKSPRGYGRPLDRRHLLT